MNKFITNAINRQLGLTVARRCIPPTPARLLQLSWARRQSELTLYPAASVPGFNQGEEHVPTRGRTLPEMYDFSDGARQYTFRNIPATALAAGYVRSLQLSSLCRSRWYGSSVQALQAAITVQIIPAR